MLLFTILGFFVFSSANATCIGQDAATKKQRTCKSSSELPDYLSKWLKSGNGDPCFEYSNPRMTKYICFFEHTNGKIYFTDCDPKKPGCGGGKVVKPKPKTPKCDKADVKTNCETGPYCSISHDHTMCKYCGTDAKQCNKVCSRGVTDQADKDAIVAKHNNLRRRIAKGQETKGLNGTGQPPATDMNELRWNDELAKVAQRWADQCIWAHDKQRGTSQYENVGQNNAFGGSSRRLSAPGFDQFIMGWYNEINDWPAANVASFSMKGVPKGKVVGHFTQVIWGATKEIGCGFVSFNNPEHPMSYSGPYIRILVCNYAPAGNWIGRPVYTAGPTASDCKNGSNDGLCTW